MNSIFRIKFPFIDIYFSVLTYFLKLLFGFQFLVNKLSRLFIFNYLGVQYDKECNGLQLNDILCDWDMKCDCICVIFYLQIEVHRLKYAP